MKKIAFMVMAILVIGIQGCSTEDEQALDQSSENNQKMTVLHFTDDDASNIDCWNKIYVRFPANWGSNEYSYFMQYARDNWFEAIQFVVSDRCETVRTWLVPCQDLDDRFNNQTKVVDAGTVTTQPDGDEETDPDSEETPISVFPEGHTPILIASQLPNNGVPGIMNSNGIVYESCTDVPPLPVAN